MERTYTSTRQGTKELKNEVGERDPFCFYGANNEDVIIHHHQ